MDNENNVSGEAEKKPTKWLVRAKFDRVAEYHVEADSKEEATAKLKENVLADYGSTVEDENIVSVEPIE